MTVQKNTETDDSHGGFIQTLVVVAERLPATVTPLIGRELERAQQIDPRITYAISLRYRADVRAGQVVVYHDGRRGDRTFEIVAPPRDPDERGRELQLLCREAA